MHDLCTYLASHPLIHVTLCSVTHIVRACGFWFCCLLISGCGCDGDCDIGTFDILKAKDRSRYEINYQLVVSRPLRRNYVGINTKKN